MSMTRTIQPRSLRSGETVAAIALSSPGQPDRIEVGLATLESLGFRSKFLASPGAELFSCGSPDERVALLHSALTDPDVKAIIGVRGGYGCQEILPNLDYRLIRASRKPIVGFSDMTSLLSAVFSRSRMTTIHGPCVAVEFADSTANPEAKESVESLRALLMGEQLPPMKFKMLREADASGRIVVGNLAMLVSLLGTPFDLSYDGAILVIEEVNEAPYRVHRMFLQLQQAGKFERLKGLLFGRFSGAPNPNAQITLEDYLQDSVQRVFGRYRFPVGFNLGIGHGGLNLPIPFGVEGRISGNTLEFDSAVS